MLEKEALLEKTLSVTPPEKEDPAPPKEWRGGGGRKGWGKGGRAPEEPAPRYQKKSPLN